MNPPHAPLATVAPAALSADEYAAIREKGEALISNAKQGDLKIYRALELTIKLTGQVRGSIFG